ncbi:MAG: phosphoribosyl-ATP diphosphatase [Pseudomonadota bacterium]
MTEFTLEDLNAIIHVRANESADASYTAKLLGKGTNKCAEKLGEEAVEAVIAAVTNDPDSLKREAADVLYHLLVLLKSENVKLSEVMAELNTRTSQSGLEEKASRNKS